MAMHSATQKPKRCAHQKFMKTKPTTTISRYLGTSEKIGSTLCGTILSASLVASTLHAEQNRTPPGDIAINSAVENRLLIDSAVPSNYIDITTKDGVLTLSGTVPNLLAKDRATAIGESIRGVRAVVNNIRVESAPRTDDEIRKDIESALLSDPATDLYEIKVQVKDGQATLSGKVNSWQEKQLSDVVVRGVKGVEDVKNELAIENTTARPDSEIAVEVMKSLERDVWVNDVLINVEVHDGIVLLTGSVSSLAEKNRVVSNAWTMGVTQVDIEGLRVEPWADEGTMQRKTEYAVRSDDQIKQAVSDAFRFDPRIDSFNPDIQVSSGVVTLSGIVDNLRAKTAAEQTATNTVGVSRVYNHLKVRVENPPEDSVLVDNVKSALRRDPLVEGYEIGISINNGTARLTGTVDTSFEKLRAREIASGVKGVTSVISGLSVSNPTFTYYSFPYSWYYNAPFYYNREPGWIATSNLNDSEIKEDIKSELSWSPFIDADKITVSVDNGVATLTGTINDWNDVRDATENAYEGGAHRVINRLKVAE